MKIYTTTVLGSPTSDCAHFGICKVDVLPPEQWDSFEPQHVRHVKAILSLSGEKGLLRFEFPFSGMRAETRRAFFSPQGFRIDSPGYLSEQLATAIGTDHRIIVPGLYLLAFSREGTILEVEIVKEAMQLYAHKNA